MSPTQQPQQTNQRLISSPTSPANQLQPTVNTQQKVNIPDSGIDHSLPSTKGHAVYKHHTLNFDGINLGLAPENHQIKSQNPSMTSTASQVTTPNWSDQNNTSQNEQNNQKPAITTTNTTSFESPLRLQQRTSSPVAPLPNSVSVAKCDLCVYRMLMSSCNRRRPLRNVVVDIYATILMPNPCPARFAVEKWWNDGRVDADRKTRNRLTRHRYNKRKRRRQRRWRRDASQNLTWMKRAHLNTTDGMYDF